MREGKRWRERKRELKVLPSLALAVVRPVRSRQGETPSSIDELPSVETIEGALKEVAFFRGGASTSPCNTSHLLIK